MKPPKNAASPTKEYPPGSLMGKLRKRRIIETLAAFAGGGVVIVELTHHILVNHYHFPHQTVDICIVTLLGALLCTLAWRWFRGKEKPRKVKIELVIIPLLILLTLYLDVSLALKMGHSEHVGIVADSDKGEIKPYPSSLQKLAVLPFANIKSDPQTDYLGFALADQIISAMTYVKDILTRPSSAIRQYQNKGTDVLTAGQDLKVDCIVMGHYLIEGDVVRLNIELVNVHSKEMIWRESIEVKYENVFKLQDIVSEKVMDGLKAQFMPDERGRIQTYIPKDPLAYEYYLRALSYPNTIHGDQLALEMLEKCVEIDPTYPPAYSQLGFRTKQLAQFGLLDPEVTKKAENYLLKALSLNSELLSALGTLAILYTETARAEDAVEITRQMLEINPNNAAVHYSLGYIYRYAGMLDESIQEMEIAIALDPKNSRFRSLGVTYMNAGEHEKALEALKIDKGSAYALGWQGITLFRQGNQNLAIDHFDRIIAMEPDGLWGLVAAAFKAIIEGDIEEGLAATRKLEKANIADAEAWYYWACRYALLGDSDGCIRALQRAVDGGYFNYPYMRTDFFLDSVRNYPEFQRILEMAKAKHEAFKKRFFPEKSMNTE